MQTWADGDLTPKSKYDKRALEAQATMAAGLCAEGRSLDSRSSAISEDHTDETTTKKLRG